MSRKNNKSIKKRYQNFLVAKERTELVKQQEKDLKKEDARLAEEAEELLEEMGLDEDEDKPERMKQEKVKKGRKIKKRSAKIPKKGEKKRYIK